MRSRPPRHHSNRPLGVNLSMPAISVSGAKFAFRWDFVNDIAIGQAMPSNVNSSGGLVRDASGLYASIAANTRRRSNLGLLVEELRTNLFLQNAALDNASWGTKTGITVSPNTWTAPDGNASGEDIVESAVTSTHVLSQSIVFAAATDYALSAIMEPLPASGTRYPGLGLATAAFASNRFATFNLSNGSQVISASTEAYAQLLSGSRYRCSMVSQSGAGATGSFASLRVCNTFAASSQSFLGVAGSGFRAWAPQLEAGLCPTSPIITAGAAATRQQDVYDLAAGPLGVFALPETTTIIETFGLPPFSIACPLLSWNGTVAAIRRKTDGSIETTDGGTIATAAQAVANWTGVQKVGYSRKSNAVTIGATGAASVSQAVTPATIVSGRLGGLGSAGMNGFIRRVTVYPFYSPAAQLDAMVA